MEFEYRVFTHTTPIAGDVGPVVALTAGNAFRQYMEDTFLPTMLKADGGWDLASHSIAVIGDTLLITIVARRIGVQG